MPKIIIDGTTIECRERIPVLQAAIEAGLAVPHYCYHPGLSVVASCRLCLMEMKVPHPQTKELVWMPKLVPSCQTLVKDGMEVRFNSDAVVQNQQHVMEYYLLNHPLDCPVCDKAGECYLQDYTEEFGQATSRMVEDKQKNPKKDIGPHTLLYQDRCVLCTRCVRFCDEIAGSGELAVVNRGSRGEIDVFPGVPLDNPLQGNVVDLCPVGALLDKEFLFKQRVWLLNSTKSVSPADSRGQTIWIDHNDGRIRRIRPRYNEKVNQWWISDEARFGWKVIHSEDRLRGPQIRDGAAWKPSRWEDLPGLVRQLITQRPESGEGARIAVVLSPMLSCEEAWLMARFIRDAAPQATLVLGHVPIYGADRTFSKGFVIKAEKCPNRRGVETIIDKVGGPSLGFGDFIGAVGAGKFATAYVTAGYPGEWVDPRWINAFEKIGSLILHELLASPLDQFAAVRIPGATWAEREGTFMNCDGLIQPFERAIPPIEGVKADGQFFFELSGQRGLFRAADVRRAMAEAIPEFKTVFEPQELPEHAH
jgi:NADH-quinone oxidoreductase subunit G